jgi:hypothetical protein
MKDQSEIELLGNQVIQEKMIKFVAFKDMSEL